MPRWASRPTLRVEDTRTEQLQEFSDEDLLQSDPAVWVISFKPVQI